VTRRVLLVGDAMLDVVVRPVAPLAPTSDTSATVRVGRGGSAANLAVAMRSAMDTAYEIVFTGVAGNDAAAYIIRADLERSHVVAHLATTDGATGVVVSLVGESGERAMMTERGVNAELTLAHVAGMIDSSLVHLHISGYTALDERTRDLVPQLIEAASVLGATTSIDVCSVGPLRAVGVDAFVSATRHATMLFANEEEALMLSGTTDVEAALTTLALTWREVVITRGPRGALVRNSDQTFFAGTQVDVVVDTTGAGDSATGTYLANRLNGVDVQMSLTYAMAAAARVVRGVGSQG
jgi:ribokinase